MHSAVYSTNRLT